MNYTEQAEATVLQLEREFQSRNNQITALDIAIHNAIEALEDGFPDDALAILKDAVK